MNFKDELSRRTEYIESVLRRYIPKHEGRQAVIMEAMEYSLLAGGKRVRPMLLMETMKMFADDISDAEPFMAAIEMIHTYSLVHDDLPAMDNDEYRRGRKTTWCVYGDGMGVLTGDALLNYAFEIMSSAVVNADNPARFAKAAQIIAGKSGIYGMIGGQVVDIMNEGMDMDINTVTYIHKLKTAALIEASMMAGAVLAGASGDTLTLIEKAARNIGIAFQIQDDVLDVTATAEELGKPVFSDEKNNKTTYVTLLGLEKSKKRTEELSSEAVNILSAVGYNEFLKELIIKLIYRGK